MKENGVDNPKVIVAGVTNTYINYIVTPEEYEVIYFKLHNLINHQLF